MMRFAPLFAGIAALIVPTLGGCGDRHAAVDGSAADAAIDSAADRSPDGAVDEGGGTPHVIRVTTTQVTDDDDGLCSLIEAIAASNSHASVNSDDCPAGTGNDVIELPAGIYESSVTIAPTESVEIRGAGMGSTIMAFRGDAITCAVRVGAAGKVVALTSLTLRPSANSGVVPGGLTGVCVSDGTLLLRHARVNGFTASGMRAEAAPGGTAKMEIYNALVDGNTSQLDGAGVAFVGADSAIAIDQSSIVNNVSDGLGGGLFAAGGANANYILNTTFSGNVARRGGGIAARILPLTYFGLYWSTITNNRARDVGGGLFLEGDGLDAHGTTTDSVIIGNSADGDAAQDNLNVDWAPGLSCTSSIFDLAGLAQQPVNVDDSCRFGASDVRLGPLMDMGGADHLPIHALLPGSLAIDAVADLRPLGLLEQRDSWNSDLGDPPLGTAASDTPPWSLFGGDLQRNPLSDLGAYEYNPRWEFELLAVADRSLAEYTVVAAASDEVSHGAAVRLGATALDAYITYQVPVPEAGQHAISLRIGSASDAGTFQLMVGEALQGPFLPVGGVQDEFAAASGWKTVDLDTVEFSSSGQKFFKFIVTGKAASSSGYTIDLDYLSVMKQ